MSCMPFQQKRRALRLVAINWLLQKPSVTAPIIGTRTLEQLESNMGAIGWSLTDEQMLRLDRVSEPPAAYPYEKAAE